MLAKLKFLLYRIDVKFDHLTIFGKLGNMIPYKWIQKSLIVIFCFMLLVPNVAFASTQGSTWVHEPPTADLPVDGNTELICFWSGWAQNYTVVTYTPVNPDAQVIYYNRNLNVNGDVTNRKYYDYYVAENRYVLKADDTSATLSGFVDEFYDSTTDIYNDTGTIFFPQRSPLRAVLKAIQGAIQGKTLIILASSAVLLTAFLTYSLLLKIFRKYS